MSCCLVASEVSCAHQRALDFGARWQAAAAILLDRRRRRCGICASFTRQVLDAKRWNLRRPKLTEKRANRRIRARAGAKAPCQVEREKRDLLTLVARARARRLDEPASRSAKRSLALDRGRTAACARRRAFSQAQVLASKRPASQLLEGEPESEFLETHKCQQAAGVCVAQLFLEHGH